MKLLFLAVLLAFVPATNAQEAVEGDSLGIEEYIWNPYGQDKVGNKFPQIEAVDAEGNLFKSAETKKVTVYNFWFAACAPCIAEIPMLTELREKYADRVDFIGITYENYDDIKKVMEKHTFNYRQIHIAKDVIEKLGVSSGYPTTAIVCNGKIVYCKHGGPDPNMPNFDLITKKTLKVYSAILDTYLK